MMLVALSCCVVPAAHAAESGLAAKTATAETRTLPGGAVLRFSSDAKYELGRPIKLQLAPMGSDKTPVQVIKLTAGRVSISIPQSKHPKTAVLIQGPRKVSAVAKGGESLVITASDRVTVAAVQGEMLAALGNDWKALASGIVRSFGAGQTSEQAAPQAPQLRLSKRVLLALHGSVTPTVHAAPDANVAHRRLWLYRVDGKQKKPLLEAEWRSDSQPLPELGPGQYEVQARAVDRFGVESAASPPITLRVVGAELPEGTRVVGDTVLLGRSTRV
jgi:hypothetical protein